MGLWNKEYLKSWKIQWKYHLLVSFQIEHSKAWSFMRVGPFLAILAPLCSEAFWETSIVTDFGIVSLLSPTQAWGGTTNPNL